MLNEQNSAMHDYYLISRALHVIERSGLAMAGAMCGTFVAAQLAKADIAAFGTLGFTAAMVLAGMIAFYLGIDVPRLPAGVARHQPRLEPVELLSASGTFLTAMAALVSVTVIILDETLQLTATVVVGSAWLIGATMQVGAGAIARLRTAPRSAG